MEIYFQGVSDWKEAVLLLIEAQEKRLKDYPGLKASAVLVSLRSGVQCLRIDKGKKGGKKVYSFETPTFQASKGARKVIQKLAGENKARKQRRRNETTRNGS